MTINSLDRVIVDEAPDTLFLHHLKQVKDKAPALIAYCLEKNERLALIAANKNDPDIQQHLHTIIYDAITHANPWMGVVSQAYDLLLPQAHSKVFLDACAFNALGLCQKAYHDAQKNNTPLQCSLGLSYAVSGGSTPIAHWLLGQGVVPETAHLSDAIKEGNETAASLIFDALSKEQRWAALSFCVGSNKEDLFKTFYPMLKQAIQTDEEQQLYQEQLDVSLVHAMYYDSMSIVTLLLEEGANPLHNASEALTSAVLFDQPKYVELLYPLRRIHHDIVFKEVSENALDALEDPAGILFSQYRRADQERILLSNEVSSQKDSSKKKM